MSSAAAAAITESAIELAISSSADKSVPVTGTVVAPPDSDIKSEFNSN
jgi:hypothetical protein